MFWIWRTTLAYALMNFKMNLSSWSICIAYFSVTVVVLSGGCKILWITIIFDVYINLICVYSVWYGCWLIKGSHSGTTIIIAIIFWWGGRAWWYNKYCVGEWVGPVSLDVFLDTVDTLSQKNCLTILWSKLKSEQKYYIL